MDERREISREQNDFECGARKGTEAPSASAGSFLFGIEASLQCLSILNQPKGCDHCVKWPVRRIASEKLTADFVEAS